MNKIKSVTITVVANMTANYSEGLGNIASVQKIFRNGKVYTIRSRESLKNAIMVQSGMYDDLETEVDGAVQKRVGKDLNATNCRALEGGYMSTKGTTNIRNSSFYVTDAISCESFVNETRFHNNLYLANNYADNNKVELKNAGLMPYQYEYDKSFKVYSLTIDLEMIGKDDNFKDEEGYQEAQNTEKAERVNMLLEAVENLSLTVKGNLDNSEPVFIVGGLSDRKTHYFENVVKVENDKLIVSPDLKSKINKGYKVGMLESRVFKNEEEINRELNPVAVSEFFAQLKKNVNEYYNI
ncbi:MAG: type I-B CRISPR-associated protein Cas7/Cst2/DevR [Clostridium sp.]|uniref:type I-B CRISPR-associated protein Cas7/Cst2/DevR n=1 Tax=Clostridium sp. DSM 8431 TaxID=1761781 RepID=UPI0008E5DE50|nr:type I-B CRISPR-associated protein Cas7/Cst2/DevR [Clostridium sp. DSM 8431]MCR4944664.1 type I-B CRISPR-associated protein Cas7/Cst2/DevR [Clostridium sp.]SFU69141.1 CRISPR-associated protein Cst2 [Clostridium sp. DSM 8431]